MLIRMAHESVCVCLFLDIVIAYSFLNHNTKNSLGHPWCLSGKESTCQCRRPRFDPWVRKIPWRREWQSMSVFLPGKSHGQRSLASYSSWGRERVRHDWVTQKQLRNSWMDLMHRAGIWEGTQNVCVLSEHHSAHICMCSPAWKHCKPHPLGVLWRLHYVGLIEQITGHWWLTLITDSSSLTRNWGKTESSNPPVLWLVPLTICPNLSLPGGFPKVTSVA